MTHLAKDRHNRKTALLLLAVAAVFFLAVIAKAWLIGR
jgi:hypothetical protein